MPKSKRIKAIGGMGVEPKQETTPDIAKAYPHRMASFRLSVDLLSKLRAYSSLTGIEQVEVLHEAVNRYLDGKIAKDSELAAMMTFAYERLMKRYEAEK